MKEVNKVEVDKWLIKEFIDDVIGIAEDVANLCYSDVPWSTIVGAVAASAILADPEAGMEFLQGCYSKEELGDIYLLMEEAASLSSFLSSSLFPEPEIESDESDGPDGSDS